MLKTTQLILTFLVFFHPSLYGEEAKKYDLKAGDVVFQEGFTKQALIIKKATQSKHTHVGVIVNNGNGLKVLEAVQPVKLTELKTWINRNPKSFYAMRLKENEKYLTAENKKKAITYLKTVIGKDYDLKFQWTDTQIYCSELVWKMYKASTGLELSEPLKFSDLDLDHPEIKALIIKRYGSMEKFESTALIVPPSSLASSTYLEEVPILK